jgi:hypothetical protein
VSGFTRGFRKGNDDSPTKESWEAVCAEAEIRQTMGMAFVKPNHKRSEVRLIALLPFFPMAALGALIGLADGNPWYH